MASILWPEGQLCLCLLDPLEPVDLSWGSCVPRSSVWGLGVGQGGSHLTDQLEAEQKALLTHWMWLKDMTFLWVFLLGKEVFGSLLQLNKSCPFDKRGLPVRLAVEKAPHFLPLFGLIGFQSVSLDNSVPGELWRK